MRRLEGFMAQKRAKERLTCCVLHMLPMFCSTGEVGDEDTDQVILKPADSLLLPVETVSVQSTNQVTSRANEPMRWQHARVGRRGRRWRPNLSLTRSEGLPKSRKISAEGDTNTRELGYICVSTTTIVKEC